MPPNNRNRTQCDHMQGAVNRATFSFAFNLLHIRCKVCHIAKSLHDLHTFWL